MATGPRECAIPRRAVRAFRVALEAWHRYLHTRRLDQALALSTVYVDTGPGDQGSAITG